MEVDNLLAAAVAAVGVASAAIWFIRVPRDRAISVLPLIVLLFNLFLQVCVVFGLNRLVGNGAYEVGAEALIVALTVVTATRRRQ